MFFRWDMAITLHQGEHGADILGETFRVPEKKTTKRISSPIALRIYSQSLWKMLPAG